MSDSFHVRLDALTAALPPAASTTRVEIHPSGEVGESDAPGYYIETFGCQMNEHDSEKVAGVLTRRGYRQVGSPEQARLVFYNTCSIREKAAHKLFSRLGLF